MGFLKKRLLGIFDSFVGALIFSLASVGVFASFFDIQYRFLNFFLKFVQNQSVINTLFLLGFLWMAIRIYLNEKKMLKKDLDIVSAKYGLGSNMAEVTKKVSQKFCKSGSVTATNELVNEDPAPGKEKVLVIEYFYDGKKATINIHEGKTLSKEELITKSSDR